MNSPASDKPELSLPEGQPLPAFPADTGKPDDITARWMAELVRLIRLPPQQIAPVLRSRGFKRMSLFGQGSRFTMLIEHPGESNRKPFSVLVFAPWFSAASGDWADICPGFDGQGDARLVEALDSLWGSVYPGLVEGALQITDLRTHGISDALLKTPYGGDMYITGQGDAAGLAVMSACRLRTLLDDFKAQGADVSGISGVYTFDAPPVTDRTMAKRWASDPIPQYRYLSGSERHLVNLWQWLKGRVHLPGTVVKNVISLPVPQQTRSRQPVTTVVGLIAAFLLLQGAAEGLEHLSVYTQWAGRSIGEPWLANLGGAAIWLAGAVGLERERCKQWLSKLVQPGLARWKQAT